MKYDAFWSVQGLLSSIMMVLTLSSWHCNAQDTNEGVTQEAADRWRRVMDEISASFKISRNSEPIPNLKRSAILNLWDPARSTRLGQAYLWTDDGRPVMIGCIMTGVGLGKSEVVNITYEFNSLDSQAIQVNKERAVWDCPTAGIEWHRLESKDGPNNSRAQRLIAMRNIARSFQVDGSARMSDAKKFELLPTPIYRYEKERSYASDGAIFAVGDLTNPYVFILIEARDKDWWVAFARSSVWELRINRGNQLFFKFDNIPLETASLSGRTYYLNPIGERRTNSAPETPLQVLK